MWGKWSGSRSGSVGPAHNFPKAIAVEFLGLPRERNSGVALRVWCGGTQYSSIQYPSNQHKSTREFNSMSLKNNLTLTILEKAEREGCTSRSDYSSSAY
jgi:hypothetical protein